MIARSLLPARGRGCETRSQRVAGEVALEAGLRRSYGRDLGDCVAGERFGADGAAAPDAWKDRPRRDPARLKPIAQRNDGARLQFLSLGDRDVVASRLLIGLRTANANDDTLPFFEP
jgi:hypothetical protein